MPGAEKRTGKSPSSVCQHMTDSAHPGLSQMEVTMMTSLLFRLSCVSQKEWQLDQLQRTAVKMDICIIITDSLVNCTWVSTLFKMLCHSVAQRVPLNNCQTMLDFGQRLPSPRDWGSSRNIQKNPTFPRQTSNKCWLTEFVYQAV